MNIARTFARLLLGAGLIFAGTDAFGLNSDAARLIRLFFQPLLVLWALWGTGFRFRAK